jgi:hypothetical protein
MSLEVRCTCGWRCQASEYYLGDRIECPDCGTKVAVNQHSDIPYGYAPYPTWQKKAPARLPRARSASLFTADDPHAGSALWLGVFAVFAALTGCGGVVAILLAVFSAREALRSNAFNRRASRPLEGRARAALVLSSSAVLLAGVAFFGFIADASHSHDNCRGDRRPVAPKVEVRHVLPPRGQTPEPGYRYPPATPYNSSQRSYNTNPSAKEDILDRVRREMREEDLRRQAQAEPDKPAPKAPDPEYRYGE